MLRLDGVSKQFGGLRAVHGVDLELVPGRMTGLIGPNGAGKTTVTNLITGYMSVTEGTITLGDRDITRLEPDVIARAGVARTFQTSRLFGELSVAENVMVACQERPGERVSLLGCLLGSRRSNRLTRAWRAEAEQLLERFGMARYADEEAGSLAYGLRRRVEIMRALALKPKVLLLDEPVAGMTGAEAELVGDVIRELSAEGLAVLLIEHNVPFVTGLCDEIFVLSYGELIASGPPADVIANEAVVEAYLGRAARV
jgi:branched-chain amino acid transport system ATP-binding protein